MAARRLYLSQPAVSLHIANLEKQLGLELFRRNGRSIQLSDAGRILLPMAQQALRHGKHLEETMSSLHGVMIGELSMGIGGSSGSGSGLPTPGAAVPSATSARATAGGRRP